MLLWTDNEDGQHIYLKTRPLCVCAQQKRVSCCQGYACPVVLCNWIYTYGCFIILTLFTVFTAEFFLLGKTDFDWTMETLIFRVSGALFSNVSLFLKGCPILKKGWPAQTRGEREKKETWTVCVHILCRRVYVHVSLLCIDRREKLWRVRYTHY